jgi:hypothetical protein
MATVKKKANESIIRLDGWVQFKGTLPTAIHYREWFDKHFLRLLSFLWDGGQLLPFSFLLLTAAAACNSVAAVCTLARLICAQEKSSARHKLIWHGTVIHGNIELVPFKNYISLWMKEETHGGRRIKKKSSGVNVGNRKLSSRSGWVQPGMRVAPLTPSHNPTPAALRRFQSFIHIWYYMCVQY